MRSSNFRKISKHLEEVAPSPERWPSDILTRRTAFAVQVAQILAIFIAGSWALYVWIKTVQPGTTTGIQAYGETAVAWSSTHEACKASFKVTVENIGTKTVTLESATYSVVAVPATRLSAAESLKVLNFTEPLGEPIENELRGMNGDIRPKEKRFKEVWFIFKPDRRKQYAIEVIIDDNKPDVLTKWHTEIESCDEKTNLGSKLSVPTL